MAGPVGRGSRLPRSRVSPVPGTMAAPHWMPLILAAAGTQIFDAGRWWTIARIRPCETSAHRPPCSVFVMPGDEVKIALHWHLTDEGWLRHPVEAS